MLGSDRRDQGSAAGRRALLRAAGVIVALGLIARGTGALAGPGDLRTVVIPVEGMVCFACAASVKRTLKAIDGVAAVEVILEKRSAQVTYMPGKVTPGTLVAAINKLGYRTGTPKEVE